MNTPSITKTGNSTTVHTNNATLYYSYSTVIAFRANGELVVRENDWSVTTGKHLNAIDGGSNQAKAARLPSAEFERRLAEIA